MKKLDLHPRIVLAVYAHPDDADVAAGGALAAFAADGAWVHIVTACDGAKGSGDPKVNIADLRALRARELGLAAELLGAASVESLGYADGDVSNDSRLRERLVAIIRRLRPEVVLGPDPTATFFDGVYVNHRDHRELGWALVDAVAPAAAMPLYFPDSGDMHHVDTLLLSGTHEPDVIVDISVGIEKKILAVLAHESQLSEDPEWVRNAVRARAQQAGREVGIACGESFRHLDFSR